LRAAAVAVYTACLSYGSVAYLSYGDVSYLSYCDAAYLFYYDAAVAAACLSYTFAVVVDNVATVKGINGYGMSRQHFDNNETSTT
jgi:hypothetical protein